MRKLYKTIAFAALSSAAFLLISLVFAQGDNLPPLPPHVTARTVLLFPQTIYPGIIDDEKTSVRYLFFAEQGDQVTLGAKRTDGTLVPKLYLYDSQNVLLTEQTPQDLSGREVLLSFTVPKRDWYFIEITYDTPSAGSYQLQLLGSSQEIFNLIPVGIPPSPNTMSILMQSGEFEFAQETYLIPFTSGVGITTVADKGTFALLSIEETVLAEGQEVAFTSDQDQWLLLRTVGEGTFTLEVQSNSGAPVAMRLEEFMTFTPSPTPSNTPLPSATPTASSTPTPTFTPSQTAIHTDTLTPSSTPKVSPTVTVTPTRRATSTPSYTSTSIKTLTPTEITISVVAGTIDLGCFAALPSRLNVGYNVIIINNNRNTLRLRQEPSYQSQLLDEMQPGTLLTIIGGPSCGQDANRTFQWWQVRKASGQIGWVAEGDSTQNPQVYFLEPIGSSSVCSNSWFFTFKSNSNDSSCPSTVIITQAAGQDFEGGRAYWYLQSPFNDHAHGTIFIIYNDRTWEAFEDFWDESMPSTDPNLVPPQGKYQPIRGIGYVWRNNPRVQQKLGWAYESEMAFTGRYQFSVNGLGSYFYIDHGIRNVILKLNISNGAWESIGNY